MQNARLSSLAVQKTLAAISRHLSLEEWDLAASQLIPLLENKKGGQKAALFEVQILRQKKAYQEALKKAQKAALDYPDELIFKLEEGKILLKLHKPKEALAAMELCKRILHTEADIYAYASALLQCGFPQKSFELLEPWLAECREGKLFALAAWAHFELKDFGKTISYYHLAMELGFKSHKLLIQLGHAYRRYGNLQQAEHLFFQLLEKDSMDVAALLGLGQCLQERGQFQKALLIYQSGKLWQQKDPRMLLQASICSINIGRFAHAEAYLTQILNAHELTPKLLSYLGYALEKQQKWQEAEQIYRKLIHLFPADPNGYRALSWMFGVGITTTISQEQALNFARIALNICQDPLTWEILSACEARIGNFKGAYEIQKALMQTDQDRESRFRRQSALRKLRQERPLTPSLVVHKLVA